MIDKQDEERRILGEVREAALRLEHLAVEVDSAEVTISALFQVIAAMKQVVAILHEARLFWQNMKIACEDLGKPDLPKSIKDKLQKYDKEKRLKLFYDNNVFRRGLMYNLAKWRALEAIAEDYIKATEQSRGKIVDDFKKLLGEAAAKAKVKQLSKDLVAVLDQAINTVNAEIKTTEGAQKLLPA